MQAWHTPEGYDVGCLNQRRKLKGMCHYTHRKPTGEELHSRAAWHKERSIAYIAAEISAGTAPASATSSRGTHATDALGHALPKRRADERRRRCRAKRRLSDPALAQKVRLLIMDRHWSLEEIDDISGSRVAAGAPLSLPTILTGRSIAATLDLSGSSPQGQVRRHLRRKGKRIRSKRLKTKGKIEILHTVKERPKQADARSRLGEWADDTLVAADPCACSCLPTGQ